MSLPSKRKLTETSKYISLLLRHKPEEADIVLDEHGWTDTKILIEKVNPKYTLNMKILEHIMFNMDKQRLEFNEDKTKIRAIHGHSIQVDAEYTELEPPDELYHGTVEKFTEAIDKEGLKKMERNYVHLSDNINMASSVGKRRENKQNGKLVIYKINSKDMFKDGFKFYKSNSGVWLVDNVPVKYLEKWN